MGINVESAEKAEIIAKRLAVESGMGESLWEMFLPAAYDQLMKEMKTANETHKCLGCHRQMNDDLACDSCEGSLCDDCAVLMRGGTHLCKNCASDPETAREHDVK